HEQDAEREDDQVVEISEDRDEIRNEIYRRKSVGRDRYRQSLCVPWHATIVRGEVDRMTILADPAGPGFDAGEHQGISRRLFCAANLAAQPPRSRLRKRPATVQRAAPCEWRTGRNRNACEIRG